MRSERPAAGFAGADVPSDDVITNCMHCGLCLPTCPTFSITGNERSSPRGRIRLIKAVAEGKLDITPGFVDEMNFCLDCQACETACPAGVKYGSLVESARDQIRRAGRERPVAAFLKKVLLRGVLARPAMLRFVARLLRMYQRSGLEWFLERSGLLRVIAPKLSSLQKLAPRPDAVPFSGTVPEVIRPVGPVRYRVGFLSGCIMDVAFAGINDDTVKVLLHHGCEVVVPSGQRCCGSLQAHNGDFESARQLARTNIDAFRTHRLDAIVMNSAGCGAMMKEYGHYLKDDPMYAAHAADLSAKVQDITEFLFTIGLRPPEREFPHTVTYHDACHLAHSQKVTMQPRALLRSVPGLQFRELPEASWCCGSAGIYNVVHHDASVKLLDRKMRNVEIVDADFLVANNPGCLLQIEFGRTRTGARTEVLHFATLLRKVYGI